MHVKYLGRKNRQRKDEAEENKGLHFVTKGSVLGNEWRGRWYKMGNRNVRRRNSREKVNVGKVTEREFEHL